jgi:hypothetical protein
MLKKGPELDVEIAVCTTAVPRPELLRATYKSFFKGIQGIDLGRAHLFINIDPVHGLEDRIEETINVALSFFNKVTVNVPETPCFTAAVEWCWQAANTEWVFHLEDDWVFKRAMPWKKVHRFLSGGSRYVVFNAKTGRVYDKLALSPSFWHIEYYKRFVGKLDHSVNPEVQLRQPWVDPEKIGVIGNKAAVRDIGRPWLSTTEWARPKLKSNFNSWVRK